MDPLTQGVLGAAAAQALFSKQLGARAWLLGAVGGVLPDVDVFIRSDMDPLLAIEYHRQFTHALAFIPVGGAMASVPWLIREKYRQQWKTVMGATTAGYATHGLLDACTTYGTQLLWPFSTMRVAWNCISIVDPIFTLILLAGVIWAARRAPWKPAALALGLCLMYLSLGVLQRERALDAQTHIVALRQQVPARRAVFPTIGNLLVWRSLYEASDTLYADRIRVPWGRLPQWTSGTAVPAMTQADLPPTLQSDPRIAEDFDRFRWFSLGWVARAPDDSTIIGDVRYSLRTDAFEPVWGIRFHPNDPVYTEWVDRTRDRDLKLGAFWQEITGEDPAYQILPAP